MPFDVACRLHDITSLYSLREMLLLVHMVTRRCHSNCLPQWHWSGATIVAAAVLHRVVLPHRWAHLEHGACCRRLLSSRLLVSANFFSCTVS